MKDKKINGKSLLILICALILIAIVVTVLVAASKLAQYGNRTAVVVPDVQEDQISQDVSEPEEYVGKNTYLPDGFYEVNGLRYYYGAGFKGVAGVDVSSYQKNIDWQLVKQSGVEFAIVRAGYRGWSTGNLDEDDCFRSHVQGADAAGLSVGVYFFSQALTPEEATEEAEYTLQLIKDYDITGPVVFDWEEVEAADARTNEMNMLQLTACAEAFCSTVEAAGYNAAVYFNQAYGYQQLNLKSLEAYDFWLAEYADIPTFMYQFDIWQYTSEGSVPGIEGNVDLNIMFSEK